MKILVNCKQCSIEFLKSLSEIKRSKSNNHFCSNRCICDYNISIRKILAQKHQEEYDINPKRCPQCQLPIPYRQKLVQIYCSQKCGALHTQKNGGHCTWDDEGKARLRELSKKNPYFNGTTHCHPKNGLDVNCPVCNKIFYKNKSSTRLYCSKKCAYQNIKLNNIWKDGKHGGYREKGGRGKQGWYKGYYCSSSWELAWAIYQLEHGLQFIRNKEGFEYEFDGNKYKFYPDFILDNGEYVEIKAFIDKKNAAKILYFPHKLNVIGRNDIKPFIQYATEKYGKDYIKLYEKK